MSTFFETSKRNFKDVPVGEIDNKVSTTEFLEAAEAVVQLFDLLGNKAFIPVQKDMTGNIKKIRDRQTSHPGQSGTLQDLVINEQAGNAKTATEGLLWLTRGLDFTAQALRANVDSDQELTQSFTSAYEATLRKHHGMIVRGIFSVAMKACPYRATFYKNLGDDQTKVADQLREWLVALERININLTIFLTDRKL